MANFEVEIIVTFTSGNGQDVRVVRRRREKGVSENPSRHPEELRQLLSRVVDKLEDDFTPPVGG